jgi:hypothetical protein
MLKIIRTLAIMLSLSLVNSVMNTYRCEYIYPEEQPQIMRVSADFGVLVHRWLMREVNNMLEKENKNKTQRFSPRTRFVKC